MGLRDNFVHGHSAESLVRDRGLGTNNEGFVYPLDLGVGFLCSFGKRCGECVFSRVEYGHAEFEGRGYPLVGSEFDALLPIGEEGIVAENVLTVSVFEIEPEDGLLDFGIGLSDDDEAYDFSAHDTSEPPSFQVLEIALDDTSLSGTEGAARFI